MPVQHSSGTLSITHLRKPRPVPLAWKIRNATRPAYLWGWLTNKAARVFGRVTGLPVGVSELRAMVIKKNGDRIDYGVVSRRVITTVFANFVIDQLQSVTTEFGDFKYHDSGTGTTAAAIGDTAIETSDGEARAVGSQIEGASSNIYRSVGVIDYSSTKAITEHGLFSQLTLGILLDRTVFAAMNVVNGDGIRFTYDYAFDAGG
jgi:hypothetical protein